MKKLIEKIKPDFIPKFEAMEKDYPNTYRALHRELSTKYIVAEMTVDEATSLHVFINEDNPNFLTAIREIFE